MQIKLSEELQQKLTAVALADILDRMPISDDEAGAWAKITVPLEPGYLLHCSACGHRVPYVEGEVWKLALHILDEHGMSWTTG